MREEEPRTRLLSSINLHKISRTTVAELRTTGIHHLEGNQNQTEAIISHRCQFIFFSTHRILYITTIWKKKKVSFPLVCA